MRPFEQNDAFGQMLSFDPNEDSRTQMRRLDANDDF